MCDPNDSGAPCACWRLARTLAFREALVSGARSKILPGVLKIQKILKNCKIMGESGGKCHIMWNQQRTALVFGGVARDRK